jgi:hypothetical protein
MTRTGIRLQLLPHERAALQKWNGTPEVQDQLQACPTDAEVVTIKLSRVDLDWLASELNHAIVKRDGCNRRSAGLNRGPAKSG